MNSYDVYYLTFPRHPESLDLTFWAFDAFVPVDDFEDLKVGKGRQGIVEVHPKKLAASSFQSVLHYFFTVSM